MLRRWSLVRMRAELGALQASAERAEAALACVASWSREFAPAARRAEHARAVTPRLDAIRLLLVAVGIAAVAALATIAF